MAEEPLHRSLGLTDEEAEEIAAILERQPNGLELAMFSVMWSEHCSYKSSRLHLGRLPSDAPWVVVGPGENAGVIDVGHGIGAAIRIESHNHPSAIEPYQGAATGVGGILRDIFTMGARPIAVMDPLRFGSLDDAHSRWVAEGVVAGISGYGNSVGVPTVGGELVFDDTYADNPLVNVLCLGVLPLERLVLGQASGPGNLAVLLGARTGRDGIGGVSVLASAGFSDEQADAEKRPNVQVGDPFEEKRLIEACLALLDEGLVVGIQDLGGAGLTCAASETASRGGVGMDLDVQAVPVREPAMNPVEIMTSESQERMLAIIEPDDLEAVLSICDRWDVLATVVGRVTDDPSGSLRIRDGFEGEVLAEMPASALHDAAPTYDRPRQAPVELGPDPVNLLAPSSEELEQTILGGLMDTAWAYEQYDHQLFLNTVAPPGGDAAVLRLKHPTTGVNTGSGLALTTDGNHRWCAVDPRRGTAHTVGESAINLACVGARPMAVVNCLNFGNPTHPEVMWQLSEAVDGMAEACEALGVPVVGGNVSLYNESRGRDIDPTPVIGLLGIVDHLERRPPGCALVDGGQLLLVGPPATGLAGSLWARERGATGGELPPFDGPAVLALGDIVGRLVTEGQLLAAHDVAAGGLGGGLVEMAVAGGVGFHVTGVADSAALLSELPIRAVLCVEPARAGEIVALIEQAGVPVMFLGEVGGDRLVVDGLLDVGLEAARRRFLGVLPSALGHGAR